MKILYLDVGLDSTSEYFRKQRNKLEICDSKCLYKPLKKGLIFKIIQFVGIYIFPPILFFIYDKWKYESKRYFFK